MFNNSNYGALGYMSKTYNYDAAQRQPDHYMTIEESIGANYMNGVFRITAVNMKLAKNNEPFVILRLSDKTGDIDGILWPERKAHNWQPPYANSLNQAFVVSGKVEFFKPRSGFSHFYLPSNPLTKGTVIIDDIRHASENELQKTKPLATLPRVWCPNRTIFERLIETVAGIQHLQLQRFVCRVLEQPLIAKKFLTAPASTKYHHSHPGGLLEHSVEVACIVNNIELYRSPTERELATVGALLHDIGKTRSYNDNGTMSLNGRLTDHSAQTLEICAESLAILEQNEYRCAEALRHIWTCASPGARHGQPAKLAIAHAVQAADRLSAEFGNESIAFSNNTTNQKSARLGQLEYLRVV